jgi:hypothetical protein
MTYFGLKKTCGGGAEQCAMAFWGVWGECGAGGVSIFFSFFLFSAPFWAPFSTRTRQGAGCAPVVFWRVRPRGLVATLVSAWARGGVHFGAPPRERHVTYTCYGHQSIVSKGFGVCDFSFGISGSGLVPQREVHAGEHLLPVRAKVLQRAHEIEPRGRRG